MTLFPQTADAFLDVVIGFFLRALAMGLLCGCALWLLRVRNTALQYACWTLVLCAMLVLPVVTSIVKPGIGITTAGYGRLATVAQRLSPSFPRYFTREGAKPIELTAKPGEPPRRAILALSWAVASITCYLLVTGVMIFRIVVGWLLIHRTANSMERLNDPRVLERMRRQCERLALPAFPELRAGVSVAIPVTFGWRNPVILLPGDWPAWPAEKLDLVLVHELSHIQRSDYLVRFFSAVNKSLYWFHPLSWWLDKRLIELAEHLSDDAALAAVPIRREQYAEILNDFASLLDHPRTSFRLGIAMSVSALGNRRMRRVLDRHRTLCSRLNRRQTLAAFGLGIPALVLIAGAQTVGPSHAGSRDITMSWYPLQPRNTWIYQKESLDGNMAHPDVERWTTEETIVGAVADPDVGGTIVTKRIRVLSDILSPDFIPANDLAKREPSESHILIRQNCVYLLDGLEANGASEAQVSPTETVSALDQNNQIRPGYRTEFLRGNVPADFCFPMAEGLTWGRVSNTSPANEFVWNVTGLNADLFGAPGGKTFHLWSHLGSGEVIDRWFEEGVGVIQEVNEHHGTYDEDRRQLLMATINGRTWRYRLTSARTVPLSKYDCDGAGWRHFSRADGTSFGSLTDCVGYTSHPK